MTGRRVRFVVIGVAVATVGMVVGCTPPKPAAPDPNNIANMTDEQVDQQLLVALPKVEAALDDPEVLADITPEHLPGMIELRDKLRTEDGRAFVTEKLRAEAATIRGGFPTRRNQIAGGLLATVAGISDGIVAADTVTGVRSPPPPTTGASVPYGTTAGNCAAPGGATSPSPVAAPANPVEGQLLTPEHDVFAKFTIGPSNVVTLVTFLTPAGEPTINGGPGVEFHGSRFTWAMHVRVHMEDVHKNFELAALRPLFHIRPVGGSTAEETQVQPIEGNVYCYAGDPAGSKRGYFDGWIQVPFGEPGFQLITEVVENDYYFRAGGPKFDLALAAPGPQYFAGADRSTIHIGEDPVTNTQPIFHSAGAFATGAKDPGAGTANVLTETNGEMSDDVEAPIVRLLAQQVRSAVSDGFAGTLLGGGPLATIQATLQAPPVAEVDARYVDPRTAFPDIVDEPVGTGALEATIHTGAKSDIYMFVLGTPCFGVTGEITIDIKADIWADSGGLTTAISPRYRHDTVKSSNFDMPLYDWALWGCRIGFALMKKGASDIPGKVDDALARALGGSGTIGGILNGLNLNAYLPTVDIDPIALADTFTGGAAVRPVVTNLDNAWCLAPGAPAGCNNDQNLLGANGVEVAADATLLAGPDLDPTHVGGNLGGRFPNVFSPSRVSKVENLVTSHRDSANQVAGLGVVIDPRLVNLALRGLVQGTTNSTTTDGLLDISNLALGPPGWSVTTRPEVAPLALATPYQDNSLPSTSTARFVAPDIRLDLRTTGEDSAPIRFSVSGTVNAGVRLIELNSTLRPTFDSPVLDIQVTSGCQVAYATGYAASYSFCGRGSGGNGGSSIESLTSLIDALVNKNIVPVIDESVGGIGLPSLDGVVPNLHVALTNLRFAQRGSYFTVYADLKPAPLLSIVASHAGYGGDEDVISLSAEDQNVDFTNVLTKYFWTVTDHLTGKAVPFTFYPGTGGTIVQVSSGAFKADDSISHTKTLDASVTLQQRAPVTNELKLRITATGGYSWNKPDLQPPPNCPPGTGSFLIDSGNTSPPVVLCK